MSVLYKGYTCSVYIIDFYTVDKMLILIILFVILSEILTHIYSDNLRTSSFYCVLNGQKTTFILRYM